MTVESILSASDAEKTAPSKPVPDPSRFSVLPRHVAVIMDGNGRWAKQRGLSRSEGHIEGAKTFRQIGEYAGDLGIRHLTFYAFSTENWARPEQEVKGIMKLFGAYLDEALERLDENLEKGIRLRFLGDKSRIDPELVALMNKVEDLTKDMTKVNLNIAVNYGAQQEILHAAQLLAAQCTEGSLKPEEITAEKLEANLYTAGQPPVDLLIRPSGEQRISNFLLWQCAYAEFWYSDVLWPDFTERDFDMALSDFEKRSRRFGGV
ncbi:MAG: di-trans,poly-cis-decaprenylcistransferase [Clostridia bacterium]|nr:di-trans,poly-cis-decaprenylcistransferase [Clostridia bacterium]